MDMATALDASVLLLSSVQWLAFSILSRLVTVPFDWIAFWSDALPVASFVSFCGCPGLNQQPCGYKPNVF
jgi:hypothetical protein